MDAPEPASMEAALEVPQSPDAIAQASLQVSSGNTLLHNATLMLGMANQPRGC